EYAYYGNRSLPLPVPYRRVPSIQRLPQKPTNADEAEYHQEYQLAKNDEPDRHVRHIWHQRGAETFARISDRVDAGDDLEPADAIEHGPRKVDASREQHRRQNN